MKVLYNWLEGSSVDWLNVCAPRRSCATRLSLAGTAVEGLEQTPAGPLLDADLTINRPDCLGHYGMAREVGGARARRGCSRST